MRTMKPKAKLRKKDARYGKMKLANGQNADETSDLSQLRKPIDINLSSLKQVAELFEKGSDEVKAILNYECDIVYECRICRSLFRSLANFISHKRAYCVEKHCIVPRRRDIDSTDSTFDLELPIDPELRKNCTNNRILRSQSQLMHVEPKKDLTSVVDMLTKKQDNSPLRIVSDDEQIVLEMMDSQQAVYQTVSKLENIATGELMKNQTLELKSILNENTGVLGPDGELIEVSNGSKNYNSADDEEALPLDDRLVANSDTVCTMCNARFATKKTLTFHMKSKHLPHRMCYPCPYCTSTFTNRWSVYRHLFKVHRKTNEQVRKIRSQIQARPYKKDMQKLEESQETNDGQGEKGKIDKGQSSNNAEDNLELEVEPQICKKCGKRFEHKAMLISHFHNCPKRVETTEQRRARKIPPQRHPGLVETEINDVGIGNDDKTKDDSSEGYRTAIIQMSDSEVPQMSSLSEKCTMDLNNRKPEPSPTDQKLESSPITKKLEPFTMNGPSESSSLSRKLESSLTDSKTESSVTNEQSESCLLARKLESSPSRRKSKLISMNEKSEVITMKKNSESSPIDRKSESSPSGRKSKIISITHKSKTSPINRKSKSPAIIRRKSKLQSTDGKSDDEAKLISLHEKSESISRKSEPLAIDRNSESNSVDRQSESSPTSRKSRGSLIDRRSELISTTKKSELVPRSRKLKLNLSDEKSESISKNRKSESSSIKADVTTIEKANLSTIVTNVPAEISIRVEEVSSLSKDVWDKMGTTSEEAGAGNFPLKNVVSPMICSPIEQSADPSIIKTTKQACKSVSDIPEVIYTRIDNSRPVELSVLSQEKKLGIQYRGIRLPTVTLEKINIPRARAKESELSSRISKEKPEIDAIPRPQQYRNFQCLPCNRRFTSAANLRKHISAHVRRDRYRCKLCNNFKSLLKCDVVAHCNTVHNTKNDRNLLAELVVEEPIHGETSVDDLNHAIETKDELEIIDVGSSTKKQETTVVRVENTIAINETTMKNNEIEESTNDLTNPVEQRPVPDPRPRRGRPPNVKNKTKRGRKKRIFGKKRVLRHVSPPRLPDEPSDEIPPVLETLEEASENNRQFSRPRAPSRMDCDPALRKMVMEVIFGSSENNKNSRDNDRGSHELDDNDSHSINDDFDQVIGCREKLVPSPPSQEPTDSNIVSTIIPGDDHFNNQQLIPNSANNNLLLQHCNNYELKTIANNHDPIVFSKQSNCVAIQVSTENPLVHQQNSLSPTLKHENPNDLLVETQQTEIIVCPEK